jgi:hypothetical protein
VSGDRWGATLKRPPAKWQRVSLGCTLPPGAQVLELWECDAPHDVVRLTAAEALELLALLERNADVLRAMAGNT